MTHTGLIRAASHAAALALLAACSPGTSAPAASISGGSDLATAPVHPESGLPLIDLAIESGGKTHNVRVEVARSATEQAMGLMFRRAMGPDEGMLFPMQPPRVASFWMRNTVIPLDIIFIGKDGRILNIAANAEPYSENSRHSAGPVKAVLELNGGRAAQLGVGPGDRVTW